MERHGMWVSNSWVFQPQQGEKLGRWSCNFSNCTCNCKAAARVIPTLVYLWSMASYLL